jgi:V/A-type H+-transporting ATPase subunit A
MAELLADFPALVDPRTGRPVLDRTVLIVNTSNMPVVAREASVFSGLTIAEFYRDMGYRVAIMVDSLSRWAEALREIGSRLREMPGEEGYPMRLADRVGKLFERAGRTRALGAPAREGAVTLIAAISPPGGDFSEPVTQAALRVTGALWALDPALANQRHFPAVDWETSYSLYGERLGAAFAAEAGPEWPALRRDMLELLQRDRDLREISTLVGPEALEDPDRLVLEVARIAREAILSQSAFDPADAFSPLGKTYALARLAIAFYRAAAGAVAAGRPLDTIDRSLARRALTSVRDAPVDALAPVVARAEASLHVAVSGRVGR